MKNIGIIGCGSRLQGLVNLIPGIGEEIQITALCDPNPASIEATKKQLAPGAKVYEDYHQLVKDPELDWVFVGSWNCYHRQQVEAAFESGKHVFCEKPLATTLEDCLAMRDAQHKSGCRFVIGFTLRYSPHYRKLKELIESGAVGRIVSMEFNEVLHFDHGGYIHGDWRRLQKNAGSHMLEKCCHDIDLAHWIVGSIPRKVASFGGLDFFKPENIHHVERVGPAPTGREAFSAWPYPREDSPFGTNKDIVDNQVVIMEFQSNARAAFHTNCSTNLPERRMYICGTEGTLRADVLTGKIELTPIGYGVEVQDIDSGGAGGHGGGDEILGASLADCILKDKPPLTSLEDGLRSAITCFGIDRALETGQVVDMAPYWEKAGIEG